ncbi:MAG: D-glycero-beta-D-manno-heptose-7-phosphate kinase [Calditrichaeota bacterium]|nr:MAG: D-glycero-beta-D-manno-heptose-7-phosphate kinase [Calditrichota bacterium]
MSIERKRIEHILNHARDKHILVVGDIMIDQYLSGIVQRISPEAPVPIVEIDQETMRLGGAANVALNVLSLGARATLVGIIGRDRMGETCRALFDAHGINPQGLVESANRPTTVKTRVIGDNQHLIRVDKEVAAPAEDIETDAINQAVDRLLDGVDAVILEDYNKGVMTPRVIEHTITQCRQRRIPVMVDPKFNHFMAYREVDVFKPNIMETARALAMELKNEDTAVEQAGQHLLRELNAESVLITRGPRGLSLFERDAGVMHIPTRVRQVADVSGAGDTVIATLTVALTGGASKQEAAIMANYAAACVVEQIGIVPVTLERLLESLA